MALEVVKPGVLSLVQDLGRFGYQHQGFTTGGALDEYAARWANRLLGNHANAALLEVTLGNAVFDAHQDTLIVVTGALAPLWVNEQSVAGWQVAHLKAGDRLRLGWVSSGQRLYVAIKDGFQVPEFLGSASTVLREQVGGLSGGRLNTGDQLPFTAHRQATGVGHRAPKTAIPDYDQGICLRVIPGNQWSDFEPDALAQFYGSTYRLTADSDRMGFRLSGPGIRYQGKPLLSEGIAFGAIQVPGNGQPIIMLKDRQTLGGYPKLGSLLPLDAFRLSQMKPGTPVTFTQIELGLAQQLMAEFYDFFDSRADGPVV